MKDYPESIFTSPEVHTSSLRIYDILTNHLADDPFVQQVLPLLKKAAENLSKTLGRTTDAEVIELLLEMDRIRDNSFVGLRDLAKAFANNSDPVVAKSGKLLTDIFHELGWSMHRLGYVAESSKLNALIDKFEKEPARSALTTIGGMAWFDSLKIAQTNFEDTYKAKVNVKIAEDYPKVRECRLAITRYLKVLLGYVDVKAEVESGAYNETSLKISDIITDIITIARSRQTRKAEDKKNAAQAGK